MTHFNCAANALTSLNMQNGNNASLTYFNAVQNFSLTCIQVDNPTYMNTNYSAAKDAGATHSVPACPCAGKHSGCKLQKCFTCKCGYQYKQ
ncbi:MAG: hypothetical protein IPM91_04455 [Bacteroidetes bacterium]|nr:hypothetical protein [Bacteroidota bacterium]